MENKFDSFPDNAKVWIYQADRILNNDEAAYIKERIEPFATQWSSHERDVVAAGELLQNCFLVLMADESAFEVSGCSIDSSVRFVKEMEQAIGVDFFNRLNVAYSDNGELRVESNDRFRDFMEKGIVSESTIVYNNLITTKAEFLTSWEVAVKDSWHKNVFGKALVKG